MRNRLSLLCACLALTVGWVSAQEATPVPFQHPVQVYSGDGSQRFSAPAPKVEKDSKTPQSPEVGVSPDSAAPPLTQLRFSNVCEGTSPGSLTLCEQIASGQVLTANHYSAGPKVYALILEVGYGYGPSVSVNEGTIPNSLNVQTDYFCGISGGVYVGCSAGQTIIAFRYWYDVTSYFLPYHSNAFVTAQDNSINAPFNHFSSSLTIQY